ncbi:Uncharacterised protein [Mycobacteroides abscessus subsp. abscessus]|uniref:AbiV family abortive infection protein n=1 Tax=Mycobacteroides abscessus subsp. abscessus TaxID=1185650 RepID=A0AB38CWS7_9MYCO|nr:hypothetical protein [Mycobacteroides abscessus]SHO99561.1 Uncharacterised protein [Mycobacteroides abscessus subsp. abscessus]OTR20143.1 hypothetical protein B9M80_05750 [Mycobacteroides abscessus]CPS14562.1 Uncharacterised protein [Mycobacteroides abscessus]CPS47182.1 Uncharacterised protein [Mycobacteroides abscessus]
MLVSDVPTYADSLATLSKSRPLLAQALVLAERRRTERLAAYLDGARLRGLEQLFAYLEAAVAAYAEIPSLSGIGFLIERVHADYKTALEATLSGYQGVAADAMRDVMEIECLLMDFAANRGNSDEWLHSDEKLRKRKYVPVRVRERLQECGVEPFSNDDFEPIDYKAHSESLHVNPGQRLSTRGPDPLDEPFPLYGDFGFMEMFEHGDRILLAIELLRIIALGVPDGYEPIGPRDKFNDAHARTHQNQVMMFGFVEGPSVLRERLGREPTAAELLGYVKDEITSKSRPFGPKAEGSN